jgi:hypothetical protein
VSGSVTWLVEDKLLLFNSWGKVNVNELMEMDHRIGAILLRRWYMASTITAVPNISRLLKT